MKEKVNEDGIKTAKIRSMIYYATCHDNILWMHPQQNENEQSINNCWFCILGHLSGNGLPPGIYEVLAGFVGERESNTLPTHF